MFLKLNTNNFSYHLRHFTVLNTNAHAQNQLSGHQVYHIINSTLSIVINDQLILGMRI